jgi:hypothetical protein
MHNKNQFYLAAWGSDGIQTLVSTLIKIIMAWLSLVVRCVPFFPKRNMLRIVLSEEEYATNRSHTKYKV